MSRAHCDPLRQYLLRRRFDRLSPEAAARRAATTGTPNWEKKR